MVESQKYAIRRPGTAILHKLAMAVIRKSATAIHHGGAITNI